MFYWLFFWGEAVARGRHFITQGAFESYILLGDIFSRSLPGTSVQRLLLFGPRRRGAGCNLCIFFPQITGCVIGLHRFVFEKPDCDRCPVLFRNLEALKTNHSKPNKRLDELPGASPKRLRWCRSEGNLRFEPRGNTKYRVKVFVSVKCPRLCTFHWHLRFFERYQCYLHHVSETRRHVAPFIQTRPLCLTLLSGCCIQSQHLCLGSPIFGQLFSDSLPSWKVIIRNNTSPKPGVDVLVVEAHGGFEWCHPLFESLFEWESSRGDWLRGPKGGVFANWRR